MFRCHSVYVFGFVLLFCGGAYGRTPAPIAAKASIVVPADGASLVGPVHVKMKAEHLEVVPAGLPKPHSGHFVLLVDVDGVPLFDRVLPGVKPFYNYSGGQTEGTLDLDPGIHSLQLVMVDHEHRPHSPPVVSRKIHIQVVGPELWKPVATPQAKPATPAAEPQAQPVAPLAAKPVPPQPPQAKPVAPQAAKPAVSPQAKPVVPQVAAQPATPTAAPQAQPAAANQEKPTTPPWSKGVVSPGYSYGTGR